MYNLKHYDSNDNEYKEDVIDFMWTYNDEFAEMEDSLVTLSNKHCINDDEWVEGRDAIKEYYNTLCNELIIFLYEDNIIACRFISYTDDQEDNYFSERVEDYTHGLHSTFALVDKKHRGNGLWGKMFTYAEENILPDYDMDRIYLATAGTNDTLQHVAEKEGLELINIVENDRDNNIDTYIYVK